MNIKAIIDEARIKLEEIKDIKTDRGQHTYMFAIDFFELAEKEFIENKEIKRDIFIIAENVFKIIYLFEFWFFTGWNVFKCFIGIVLVFF